jgi:hypothetical protein
MASFEPADSWLFLALARSDGSSLAGFLASADHINRGLPTYDEVRHSLGRLLATGLVAEAGDWVTLTAGGRALFASAGGLSAQPMQQLMAAGAALQSVPLPFGKVAPYAVPRELFDYCVRTQAQWAQRS